MTAPTPATAEELREAQRAEYGTFVALVPIDIHGGRAANPGDPIPVSHVERGVVLPEQVAKPSTKTGREALRAVGLNYPEPPEAPGSATVAATGGTDEKKKG